MMVGDHANTTQQVAAAARKSGMNPGAPKMTADQQRMLTGLQGASGADFDRLYSQDQVMAHQQALALHQGFAQGGSDPNLKAVAQTAVPIVQTHLDRARRLPNG
jgi:putative membrane protein